MAFSRCVFSLCGASTVLQWNRSLFPRPDSVDLFQFWCARDEEILHSSDTQTEPLNTLKLQAHVLDKLGNQQSQITQALVCSRCTSSDVTVVHIRVNRTDTAISLVYLVQTSIRIFEHFDSVKKFSVCKFRLQICSQSDATPTPTLCHQTAPLIALTPASSTQDLLALAINTNLDKFQNGFVPKHSDPMIPTARHSNRPFCSGKPRLKNDPFPNRTAPPGLLTYRALRLSPL